MFGSLGALVQVILILYPFHAIDLWVWAHRVNMSIQPLKSSGFYVESFTLWILFTVHLSKYMSLLVLPLTFLSATWWCPQWWVSIVLLSLLASCLVHRTPTSHRYTHFTWVLSRSGVEPECGDVSTLHYLKVLLFCSFQIIANCVSLLILSSALPVFSRTLGKDMAWTANAIFIKDCCQIPATYF